MNQASLKASSVFITHPARTTGPFSLEVGDSCVQQSKNCDFKIAVAVVGEIENVEVARSTSYSSNWKIYQVALGHQTVPVLLPSLTYLSTLSIKEWIGLCKDGPATLSVV
jgi:hypothetical protein